MKARQRLLKNALSVGPFWKVVFIILMAFTLAAFPSRNSYILGKAITPIAFAYGDWEGEEGGQGQGHGDNGHGGHEGGGSGGHGGKGESDSLHGEGPAAAGHAGKEGHLGLSGLTRMGGFQGLSPLSAQEEAGLIGNWGEAPRNRDF